MERRGRSFVRSNASFKEIELGLINPVKAVQCLIAFMFIACLSGATDLPGIESTSLHLLNVFYVNVTPF